MKRKGWQGIRFSILLGTVLAFFGVTGLSAMAGELSGGAAKNVEAMPLKPGQKWVYRDTAGETVIRVAARERFAEVDCFRIDWVGAAPFQSEYWQVKGDGIYVVGRRVMDHVSRFATPYLLFRYRLVPGDSWETTVASETLTDTLRYSVGAEEEVTTPAGRFRAFPVSERGKTLEYRRWYARGVGMVKEATLLPDGSLLDEKVLVRWRE